MKKKQKVQRGRRSTAFTKEHVSDFFDAHPELEIIRGMMRECAPSFLEAMSILSDFRVYPRRFVRVSASSDDLSRLSTTDIRAGAAVLGFSTPEAVRPELVSMAKLRAGESWAVACLLVPVPSLEDRPDLLVHILCDHEGNLAACINSEIGTRWSMFEGDHATTSSLLLDWRHEHDFFQEAAGRFSAEFAGFTPECPFDMRVMVDELALFMAREMRTFADVEAHEAATTAGVLMATRQHATEVTEDLETQLQSAQVSEGQFKRMKLDLEKERLAASGTRSRADRLEKELRLARRELAQAKHVGQVPSDGAGTIADAVDRLLGL